MGNNSCLYTCSSIISYVNFVLGNSIGDFLHFAHGQHGDSRITYDVDSCQVIHALLLSSLMKFHIIMNLCYVKLPLL